MIGFEFEIIDFCQKQDRPPNIPISFIRLKISRYRKKVLWFITMIAESENKEMDDF